MKCDTKIYKEHNLVVDTVVGDVTVEELSDKFFLLFRNPNYDVSMRGLCDLRGATNQMERSEFVELTDEVEATTHFGETRWAIITEDPMLTAFAMIFQRRVGIDGNIRVFSTLKAAEDYIEIPVSDLVT